MEWFFHWDNAPFHTAGANSIQLLQHPHYSPDLALANFFLFRRVKEELAGIRLTPETIKTSCEGVIRGIAMEEFVAAFRRWLDCCNKCVQTGSGYVEKS